MSMLGISLLREIVIKEGITSPAAIFNALRDEIIKTLKQSGIQGEQKDGMDMAMITIDHWQNTLQFAGANNPAYLIPHSGTQLIEGNPSKLVKIEGITDDDKLFYELKPDKMPIAIYERMESFTEITVKVSKGDMIYLFSDGYADQFGGRKGKKFKTPNFKKLLALVSDMPAEKQREKIAQVFAEWKNSYEQVDDVTVVGVRL